MNIRNKPSLAARITERTPLWNAGDIDGRCRRIANALAGTKLENQRVCLFANTKLAGSVESVCDFEDFKNMKIGISGHQNIGSPETIAWVRQEMLRHLEARALLIGISSLAVGADQLFASAVLETRSTLEVVIPCDGYETTFTDVDALTTYRTLLGAAARTHFLNFPEPSEEAFYRAGCLVADLSDAMILVWDGKPAGGRGGTGDIAEYLSKRSRPYFWINPRETITSLVR